MANKATYIEKAAKYDKEYRRIVHSWIRDYVYEHPCVDCDVNDFRMTHFDHRDRSQKSFEISSAIKKGYSLQRIQDEIAKCDVRCANHHALRTAEQLGWYKDLL